MKVFHSGGSAWIMGLNLRGEKVGTAFGFIFAVMMIVLFVFDMNEVYLDPLVADGSFIYSTLVKTLVGIVSVYILSVVVGNAYDLVASS
jgi:uncharacterized membrane protein